MAIVNRLEFLQSLRESELSQLVLIPLFEAMKFHDIRYTHGVLEYGKDIIFFLNHPLQGVQCYAATVKRFQLDGTVSDSRSIREVHFQVKQALTEPFIDPFDGRSLRVDGVFVVTPFSISQACIRSISAELQQDARLVNFIDGPRLLNLLDEHDPNLLSSLPSSEARYLHLLLRRFNEQPTFGRLGMSRSLTLLDIYTGGDLSFVTEETARTISFAAQPAVEQRLPLREIFARHRHCVVVADVGAGKTSLLQKFLAEHAAGEEGPHSPSFVPLFVPLASLDDGSLASPSKFRAGVERYVSEADGFDAFDWKDTSEYALLLDGFDELALGHDVVAAALGEFRESFGALLITSRPTRVPSLGARFTYLRLNPFSERNVANFLERWFGEHEGRAEEVRQTIASNAVLSKFCRSPLMLTLYTILASRLSIDRLPTRRTDIYDDIVNMLLGDWDRMRRIRNHFSRDLKRHALEMIAYSTHLARRRTLPVQALQEACATALEGRSGEARSLLDEIVYRGCLVRQNSTGEYEFVHLSFQEYFAASRLMRIGESGFAQRYLMDDWWRAALGFYFGIVRTMDSIASQRRRRRRDGLLGLRLIEFLAEADYTSTSTRDWIHRTLASEVLEGPDLSESEMTASVRLGEAVVDTLETLAGQSTARYNACNMLRVLLLVDSERSLSILFQHRSDLSRIGLRCLVEIISRAIFRTGTVSRFEFLLEALGQLDLKLSGLTSHDYSECVSLINELRGLSGHLSDVLESADLLRRDANLRKRLETRTGALDQQVAILENKAIGFLCAMPDRPLVVAVEHSIADISAFRDDVLTQVLREFHDRVDSSARGKARRAGQRIMLDAITAMEQISARKDISFSRIHKILLDACAFNARQARPDKGH